MSNAVNTVLFVYFAKEWVKREADREIYFIFAKKSHNYRFFILHLNIADIEREISQRSICCECMYVKNKLPTYESDVSSQSRLWPVGVFTRRVASAQLVYYMLC